jgi:hypothetical protein
VSSQSTSLIPSPRLVPSNRAISQSDTTQSGDNYVWSVSVGDDGAFNFYAAPRKNSSSDSSSGNNALSQWSDYFSAGASGSGWSQYQMRNVASQYMLVASMPTPASGRYVDVYA